MANTSRYRYIQFYGGRILQSREVGQLQRIQEGLNSNGTSKVAFDLNAAYREGATFNIVPSLSGTTVTLSKTDSSDAMYVFVRGRWETIQPSEIANTLSISSTGGNVYLNWVLRQVTSSEDPTLIDTNTGEATADMGELDLSVSTTDTSGTALTSSQFEKNTSPIILFTYNTSKVLAPIDNLAARALASTQTSGYVKLSTDTSKIAVASDDSRLGGIGSIADGYITDVKIRTPTAIGGNNNDGTPIYNLTGDPGGINSSKIVHVSGSQRVSDLLDWIKGQINNIASIFSSHIGARLGLGTTHPMPTATDVGAAPLSHVSLGLGVAGSHPPIVAANSGGFRVNRDPSVPAQNADSGFGIFNGSDMSVALLHNGDIYCGFNRNVVANPLGGPTNGPLPYLSTVVDVLAEHVNQTSHANPHGLAASDIGAASTSYVDNSSANVLASANNYTNSGLSTKQDIIGFTPVQQGGGIGQNGNKVFIGWDGGNLRATVDTTDLGPLVFTRSKLVLQDVTYARSFGSVYQNTSSREMHVYANGTQNGSVGQNSEMRGAIGNDPNSLVDIIYNGSTNGGGNRGVFMVVPPQCYYRVNFVVTAGSPSLVMLRWTEATYN